MLYSSDVHLEDWKHFWKYLWKLGHSKFVLPSFQKCFQKCFQSSKYTSLLLPVGSFSNTDEFLIEEMHQFLIYSKNILDSPITGSKNFQVVYCCHNLIILFLRNQFIIYSLNIIQILYICRFNI